jgi:hypothetical protein
MDGNSAKKAPVLDHIVSTNNASNGQPAPTPPPSPIAAKPLQSASNGVNSALGNPQRQAKKQTSQPIRQEANKPQAGNVPQNRRTDKSQFEIELTKTVNKIMLKHFEHASEQIVQQVLSEVRARLPGQRKD